MAVQDSRNSEEEPSTDAPVDWFANVVQTDAESATPATVRDGTGPAPEEPLQANTESTAIGQWLEGYQRLPSWILIPQIVLAVGWALATLTNIFQADWWSGQAIRDFVATETGLRVNVYQHVLTGLVEPLPAVTAIVVAAIQIAIVVMLVFNYRVMVALSLAAFLNVQFILAGVVNPSVFYLVAALGIAIWRIETSANAETLQRLSDFTIMSGLVAVAFLAPGVRTLQPEGVLDDPALVLIFLAFLAMVAMWWVNRRVALAEQTLARLTDPDGYYHNARFSEPRPSFRGIGVSVVAAAAILVVGFTLVNDSEPISATEEVQAVATDSAFGSFDTPYPFGLDVTLSYNDLEFGQSREWRVQVIESALDDDSPIQSDPITDGNLARARIRLTYVGDSGTGPIGDMRFEAVGLTGNVYPAKTEGCGEPEGRLSGGQLLSLIHI